ncbi:MAG TPA: O-antigen ligase family protein [Candidatus Hydrogenedens sp.]|nr:O-antigen ligase family protein [Candidatus Hydrogenedens sp.]
MNMNLFKNENVIHTLIFSSIVLPPLIFSFEFTSFLYPKEIVLSGLLLLLFPFFLARTETLVVNLHSLLFLILILFFCLSIFYAKVPEQTLIRVSELTLFLVYIIVIDDFCVKSTYKNAMDLGIIISGLGISLTLIIQKYNIVPVLFPTFPEYKQLYSVFGNQNLAGSYIALSMIWLLTRKQEIIRKNLYVVLCSFVLGYGLFLSNSRSSWIAFLFCFILFIFDMGRDKEDKYHLSIGLSLGILLALILALPTVIPRITQSFSGSDVGFRTRLWIYDGTIRMFLKNPLLGVGFGNYYYWSPKYLGDALHSNYGNIHYRNELLTLHAHNDILELLAEGGIIIGILILIFYFLPIILYRKNYVWIVFLITSLFNPIFISGFHISIALFSLMNHINIGTKSVMNILSRYELFLNRKWRYVVVVLGIFIMVFLSYTLWLPDYKLRQAEKQLILHIDCSSHYQMLVKSRFASYATWEGYAQSLILKKDYENAYHVLKKALEKTDSGFIYLLLGRCASELGKKEESIRWYRECLYRFPNNIEAQEGVKVNSDLK